MSPGDYEKLGVFYLGKSYDLDQKRRGELPLLYDSKDLVTHGVCVGMTGSGKTGLCISLIEEVAIDGIPAIVIDPKGDLANLLLTFPRLDPADFEPWVNEEDAQRKGLSTTDYARQQAELWRRGLAEWGQNGARIQRLRDAAEFTVYTPGSSAGVAVSLLRDFALPPVEVLEDVELFRERVSSTATGLLGLADVAVDSPQAREHILLSTILADAWARGRGLDLPGLIAAVQQPPVSRVGVMEIETIYPAKDRFDLAMRLNALIAAPGFARWTEGAPLHVPSLLRTAAGKPRVAIFSIGHLSDAERMFFVAMLLNELLGWVRAQSGTTSLRALLYMDEIAGYVPPVANPPSKQPLLTLMKQSRAFGLGVLLATQNPVDLDYKGLSNAGTWFIGRLQTERDKARLLDGLEGAATGAGAGFDRAAMGEILSRLGSRVFLLNNVHDDGPIVFESRWAMSYLRGPLTRAQIKTLTGGSTTPVAQEVRAVDAPVAASTTAPPVADAAATRPVLPPEIPQYFLPVRGSADAASLRYQPLLLGLGRIYYSDTKIGVDLEVPAAYLAAFAAGPIELDWDAAEPVELTERDVEPAPLAGVPFAALPAAAGRKRSYDEWSGGMADLMFRQHKLELLRSGRYKLVSRPAESEGEFRTRLEQLAREERDEAAAALRTRYAPRLATLQERIRKAEQQRQVQSEQASSAKWQAALSFGSAIVSAFMGRKLASSGNVGRAATAARASRAFKESSDVGRAAENVDAVRSQLAELERLFESELEALSMRFDTLSETLERVSLKPKKTNIAVRAVMLVWAPHRAGAPAWR